MAVDPRDSQRRPAAEEPASGEKALEADALRAVLAAAAGWSVRHAKNERAAPRGDPAHAAYPADLPLQPHQQPAAAYARISSWKEYARTPLVDAKELAEVLGVRKLYLKDETCRFGDVGSFKALGGAYAAEVFCEERGAGGDPDAAADGPAAGKPIEGRPIFATASAGNHGMGLAWGARRLGCACHVFLHEGVPEEAAERVRSLGATVHRVRGSYEESCARCHETCKEEENWVLVQDVDIAGTYEKIPLDIFAGYTVLAREMEQQIREIEEMTELAVPTHVLVNTGVGGLACAVCAHNWGSYKENRPRFVCVEPAAAACCRFSCERGELSTVGEGESHEPGEEGHGGRKGTVQVGLDCKTPAPSSWHILSRGCDDFVSVSDAAVEPCMEALRRSCGILAGKSAVAGLGVLFAAAAGGGADGLRQALGLDENSRVVVVVCEKGVEPHEKAAGP